MTRILWKWKPILAELLGGAFGALIVLWAIYG